MKIEHAELSLKDKARLLQAQKIAATSDRRKKHGCVITKGGRVLSIGVNTARNDRSVFETINHEDRSYHAEEMALKAIGGRASGAVVYVARVGYRGKPLMSKPCDSCMTMLIEANVKKIVYTVDSAVSVH